MADWRSAPILVLVSTFKFLKNEDRLNAALTCHHWLNAFESPTLWEEMSFVMDGDLVDDSKRALQFVRKHSTSVKRLKLHFRRCRSQKIVEALENIQCLFENLACYGRLESFEVENFSFHRHRESSNRMMAAFKSFLASQRQFSKVRFFKTCFDEQRGLDILERIVYQNKDIRFLGLWYFFEQGVDVYRHVEYERLLGLANLEVVELDYCCTSETVLDILGAKKRLRVLSILCDQNEGFHHTIPEKSWREFKRPHIDIKYEIVEVVTLQQFMDVMPQSTCASEFTYKCGLSLRSDNNLRTHGISILQYITHAFQDYFREISLDFGFVNISLLEDSILNLIMTCAHLEVINLCGVLSPTLARRICEGSLSNTPKSLKQVDLMFYFCNFETVDEMNRMQEYKQRLKAMGVAFHFNLLTFQSVD
ncbi:uncharacterized protein [Parasteatoda tepidariorum]|uniref:uncharacterized protein n=1 Tax=Parasteatoda tepidariorum TaxID=114398 RepID=UPI0039BD90F6